MGRFRHDAGATRENADGNLESRQEHPTAADVVLAHVFSWTVGESILQQPAGTKSVSAEIE